MMCSDAFVRVAAAWWVMFSILYTFWELSVALNPYVDYAEPYYPCALIAAWTTPVAVYVGRLLPRLRALRRP